jgi:hypothetical protein
MRVGLKQEATMKNNLLSILLVASILSACAPSATALPSTAVPPTVVAPTEVVIPTDTPQATVTIEPPATSLPAETSTPVFDWATNFAAPVLEAIAGQPPTFEDVFSDPNSGWFNGITSGDTPTKIDGEKSYDRGEYRIIANVASAESPTVCSGVQDENVGIFEDFVAEFDVNFISGAQGGWQLEFHRNMGFYTLSLDTVGNLSFASCRLDTGECATLATTTGAHIRLDDYNHIQLIVQNTGMAVFVNETPTLYADDPAHVDANTLGYFSLNVCNAGADPLDTKWDNFRVWDISWLP